MKKFLCWNTIILLAIICLSAFLRLYKLDSIPATLNQDETAIGYNAYSLLKTGADEHGKFLPLSLQSFGDWKLPIYPVIDTIPIFLFGLTEIAVRLPSVIAGIAGTVLVYCIAKKLFKREGIGLFSALFFAVSPWNIYFSRQAYEVNLATTIFLTGLLLFLTYLQTLKSRYLLYAAILFGLTLFIYHSYLIFMPLFMLSLFAVYFEKIKISKNLIGIAFVFLIFVFASYFSTFSGSVKKISNLAVYNDKDVIYRRVEKLRGDSSPENPIFKRVIHTKYLAIPYQVAQNYLASFSPSFLFDKGGEKLANNLGDFGSLYLFDALLLVLGFSLLFWNREKFLPLLVLWLVISPIPSSITQDAPSTTRLFILMPLFTIISGYGAYLLFLYCKNRMILHKVIGAILLFLFVLNIVFFIDVYFVHINVQRARFLHYGYKQAVLLTQKYPDYNVVMRGPENFPYISFLFYNKYDPLKFREEATYYPLTNEGFDFVKSFGRYAFVDVINYTNLKHHTIYIDDTRLDDRKNSIFLPSGEIVFGYLINE